MIKLNKKELAALITLIDNHFPKTNDILFDTMVIEQMEKQSEFNKSLLSAFIKLNESFKLIEE